MSLAPQEANVLREAISDRLDAIRREFFVAEARLSLVMRVPRKPGCYLTLTSDPAPDVAAELLAREGTSAPRECPEGGEFIADRCPACGHHFTQPTEGTVA